MKFITWRYRCRRLLVSFHPCTTTTDVIDWIIDNLIDKNRTRRAVLRKLREMGLQFKLPTKKSNAAARKGWSQEEDDFLTDLYYEHRLNEGKLHLLEIFLSVCL